MSDVVGNITFGPVGIEFLQETSVMPANTTQIGGSHYQGAIQTWDYIIAQDLGYLEGNIVKYVSRWKKKNGLEDLKKARHYLDKLIEVTEQQAGTPGQP